MKSSIIALIVVLVIIIVGLVIPLFLPEATSCTKIGCTCLRGEDKIKLTGEIPCNSCSSLKSMFGFYFINIAKVCDGREIINCDVENYPVVRIDFDNCGYKLQSFLSPVINLE